MSPRSISSAPISSKSSSEDFPIPVTSLLSEVSCKLTPLNSAVLVLREGNTGRSGNSTGPLLGIQGETCTVRFPAGPTNFWSTIVKPYYEAEPEKAANTGTPENSPGNAKNPATNENPKIGAKPVQMNKNTQNQQNQEREEKPDSESIAEPEKLPRRNSGRARQLLERFRQNVADISIFLQGIATTPLN